MEKYQYYLQKKSMWLAGKMPGQSFKKVIFSFQQHSPAVWNNVVVSQRTHDGEVDGKADFQKKIMGLGADVLDTKKKIPGRQWQVSRNQCPQLPVCDLW